MSNLDDAQEQLEWATRYENYIAALCPFHEDSKPSLLVYEDHYFCLACNAKGKTSKLLDGNGRFIKPTVPVYNPFTSWLRKSSLFENLKFAYQTLKKFPYLGSYLHSRKIPEELIKRLKIGYKDGWFTVPIFDSKDNLLGAVARNSFPEAKSRYFTPKNQSNLLYLPQNRHFPQRRAIFLTFGILDAISIDSFYPGASCAVTGGKRVDPRMLDFIRKAIFIVPDNGEEKEAHLLASRLGWRGNVLDIRYPDNSKDMNDLLIHHEDIFHELLRTHLEE